MTWPQRWFCLFTALSLFGAGTIGFTFVYWRSVGKVVSDWWVKVISRLIQLPVGSVSIWATYTAAHKDVWVEAAVSGGGCVIIWEIVKELVESRVKAADKIDKSELKRAEHELEARTALLTVFRDAVIEKVRRLLRQLSRTGYRSARLAPIRASLTPDTHLDDLLQGLAVYFAGRLPEEQLPVRNFRVGLYAHRDGVMEPIRAVNLNNPGYNVFSSYQRHQASYSIDQTEKPALVVTCVRMRQTLIVEDCIEAEKRDAFHFFNVDQKGYLRSMAAYFLDEVCGLDGRMTIGALVIDTDAPGFFREADRDFLEFCLREFGARLKLELLLHAMLTGRGADNEPADHRQADREGTETGGAVRQEEGSPAAEDAEGRGTGPEDYPA